MAQECTQVERDSVVSEFRTGALSRRDAVARLLSIGLSGPAAYGALGFAVVSSGTAAAELKEIPTSPVEIAKIMDRLTKFVSSKAVLESIGTSGGTQNLKLDDRIRRLTMAATDDVGLKNAGIDPAKLRMSLRIFEKDAEGRESNLARIYTVEKNAAIATGVGPMQALPMSEGQIQSAIKLSPQEIPTRPAGGMCLSYGKDLCVSAGVP